MPLDPEGMMSADDAGSPLFAKPLHVGRPNLGDRQRFFERVGEVLDSAWLTNQGSLVQELETRLAKYLDVRHCIVTCNGTVALELAIRAVGLKGEVIVPSLTFIATAHSLQWQEIRPVFCDIDGDSLCIDPMEIARHITPRTTGIVGVHLYGRPCDTEALDAVARRHGLNVLYDAAHAFGCSHNGRMIGNFGRCEVFSFHATKIFNTFEGGAITTNDDDLADRIRLMKNFGFAGEDNVIYLGINGKMNEVCAAMGLTNLESLPRFVDVNRRNFQAYREGLRGVPGIDLVLHDDAERGNYQYVVVQVEESEFGLSRDRLLEALKARNILARRYFYPGCHRMEPYRSRYPDAGRVLGRTEAFCERVLVLPTGTQTSETQIKSICDLIGSLGRTR